MAKPSNSTTVHFPPEVPLYGVEGALKVQTAIAALPVVKALHIQHHHLGNTGTVHLFEWLLSASGRRYRLQIEEIDVGSCGIGDEGLTAIGNYLSNNRKLKSIVLTKNDFEWNPATLEKFVDAVNSSRLESLAVNTMTNGRRFVPYMLSHFQTPYLKTFRASMTNLTPDVAPAIAEYITSPRCRLRTLNVAGNALSVEGLEVVVKALERNYSLRAVELFGNADVSEVTQELNRKKMDLEKRNDRLQTCVAREALSLLRYSRILLLQGGRTPPVEDLAPSSFTRLPLELKQHILTFIAPHLSTTQCLQIFNFASSPATLPLLNLHSSASCLPDPSAMPFGMFGSTDSPCANGCIGAINSLLCKKETLRAEWLLKVRCDVPDPDTSPL